MNARAGATLQLRGVDVSVAGTVICHDIDLTLPEGELHVLFGPNGSGKSSLLAAILGLPPFEVTAGDVLFSGQRINDLSIDERARLGVGVSFQRPPALVGVTVREFADAIGATENLQQASKALDLAGFEDRGVNSGFSGGEIKRWELLKVTLQRPTLALFDEPESGVDLEHIAAVGAAINQIMQGPSAEGRPVSALAITHTGFILDYVNAHRGHLMVDGRIVGSDDPRTLFKRIQQHGYSSTVTAESGTS